LFESISRPSPLTLWWGRCKYYVPFLFSFLFHFSIFWMTSRPSIAYLVSLLLFVRNSVCYLTLSPPSPPVRRTVPSLPPPSFAARPAPCLYFNGSLMGTLWTDPLHLRIGGLPERRNPSVHCLNAVELLPRVRLTVTARQKTSSNRTLCFDP